MTNFNLNITRDHYEDQKQIKTIDNVIFYLLLALLVIIPLMLIAHMTNFIAPEISTSNLLSTGMKADLYGFFRSKVLYIITGVIFVLYIYKVLVLNYKIKGTIINVFVFSSIILICISSIFAQYKMLALFGFVNKNQGLLTYICYFLLFHVSYNIYYNKKNLYFVAYSMIPFTIINVTLSTLNFFGLNLLEYNFVNNLLFIFVPENVELSSSSSIVGTLSHGNYMSGFAAVLALLNIIISLLSNRKHEIIINYILFTFNIIIVLTSLATSGFLTFIAVLLLFLLTITISHKRFSLKKIMVRTVIAFGIFLILTISFSFHNPKVWDETFGKVTFTNPFVTSMEINDFNSIFFNRVNAESDQKFELPDIPESGVGTGSGRLFIWGETLKLILDKPILGYGFGSFPYYFPQYDIDKIANIETSNVYVDKPHSIYFSIGFHAGIIVLLLFIGINIILLSIGYKNIVSKFKLKNIHIIHIALYFSIIAFLIQGIFNEFVISTALYYWIISGALLGIFKDTTEQVVN